MAAIDEATRPGQLAQLSVVAWFAMNGTFVLPLVVPAAGPASPWLRAL